MTNIFFLFFNFFQEFDSEITDTVNSFLKTEEEFVPASDDTPPNNPEVEEQQRDGKSIPELDPILKAFMFTYGEENKPRILKNVRILTSQRKSLSSSGDPSNSSSQIEEDRVVKPPSTVVEKPKASLPYITKNNYSGVTIDSTPCSVQEKTSRKKFKTILGEYPSISVRKDTTNEKYNSTSSHHKKRTRISLQGLSDAEKYLRIRSQNNVASKKCREKKKLQMQDMQLECHYHEQLNEKLKREHTLLSERRDKWKELFLQCNS